MVTTPFTSFICVDREISLPTGVRYRPVAPPAADAELPHLVGPDEVKALAEIVMGRPADLDYARARARDRRSVTLAILAAGLCLLLAGVDYFLYQAPPPANAVVETCTGAALPDDCAKAFAP